MSSKFRSKSWRGLSNALGLWDQKSVSDKVSTDPIVPVVALDIGMNDYSPVFASTVSVLGAPTGIITYKIVSPIIASSPADLLSFPNNLNLETLILGWSLSVDMSGGAGTENLHWVKVSSLFGTDPATPVGVTTSVQNRWGYFDFAAGKTNVTASMGPNQQRSDAAIISAHSADRPIWVPAGGGFVVQMELDPAPANFAAGCTVTAQAYGVQFVKGARGPWM